MAGSEGKGRTCHGPLAGTIEGALREGKGIAPLIDTWDEGVRGSWTKGRGGRETGRTASTAGETAKGEREKEREREREDARWRGDRAEAYVDGALPGDPPDAGLTLLRGRSLVAAAESVAAAMPPPACGTRRSC